MNFALLWIDALLVALLWVVAAVAWIGRIKRRWIGVALSSLVVLVPFAILGSFVASAAMMKFSMRIEPNWFAYATSLLSAYLFGTALVLHFAARREPGMSPAAATWRRAPATLAWLTSMAVGYMILLNMDLAIRARCAILSVQVNSLYLATMPAITSDDQNAAPIYEKAFARLNEDPATDVNNPPLGNSSHFDPNEPATIAFLARQADTLAVLRRAAALPGCRFDQDLLVPDFARTFPSLGEMRLAAQVLNLDAREEIARGHISLAITDAATILRMSRHFGQRPLLISALVGIGIAAVGDETLEDTLPAVKNGNELSGLHLEQLPSIGRMFQQALRGEERFGLMLYGNMPASRLESVKGKDLQVQDTGVLSSGAGLTGAFFRVFFLDTDAYMKLMENLQNLSIQPYYQVRDQLSDMQNVKSGYGLFTSILAPSLLRSFQTLGKTESYDACATVAVAMTRYRLDHGNLPDQFRQLVPAYLDSIPLDPFNGQPLRLIVGDNQWIIYGIGTGKDEGPHAKPDWNKGNVVFVLKFADTTTRPDRQSSHSP